MATQPPPYPHLGVLGFGNMGGAVLRGIWRANPRPVSRATAVVRREESAEALRRELPGVEVSLAAADLADADVLLLAVKPQQMAEAIQPLTGRCEGKLVVTVAAGLPTAWFEKRLAGARVVRAMPNTPMLVGKGAVGICAGATATEADMTAVRGLFVGSVIVELPEDQMDAVTAVSGSGPAYFYAFVEALASAGEANGLARADAEALARATLIGAAALLEASGETTRALRERITSPGGTTAAALEALDAGGMDDLVRSAVTAATNRGRELAEG